MHLLTLNLNYHPKVQSLQPHQQYLNFHLFLEFFDFYKNIIDTKLDINLNKNIFSVKLEDDLNKPKIIVDVQDLIKNILEKKLDKYINKEDDAQKIELLGIKSLF